MRSVFYTTLVLATLSAGCQSTKSSAIVPTASHSPMKTAAKPPAAEAGCAMCVYKMKGVYDCVLAVKIDGKPYLVSGSSIDDHGDAHAPDGLCHVARAAKVTGSVEGDRFVAKEFRLTP